MEGTGPKSGPSSIVVVDGDVSPELLLNRRELADAAAKCPLLMEDEDFMLNPVAWRGM